MNQVRAYHFPKGICQAEKLERTEMHTMATSRGRDHLGLRAATVFAFALQDGGLPRLCCENKRRFDDAASSHVLGNFPLRLENGIFQRFPETSSDYCTH